MSESVGLVAWTLVCFAAGVGCSWFIIDAIYRIRFGQEGGHDR